MLCCGNSRLLHFLPECWCFRFSWQLPWLDSSCKLSGLPWQLLKYPFRCLSLICKLFWVGPVHTWFRCQPQTWEEFTHRAQNYSSLALSSLESSPHFGSCGHKGLCPLISQTRKAAVSTRASGNSHHLCVHGPKLPIFHSHPKSAHLCSCSRAFRELFLLVWVWGWGTIFCPDFTVVTCRRVS